MVKIIRLNLSKIKYGGDSIGDDIRIEVEALNKFLRVDKKIRVGTTMEVNREIGRFETDQKMFAAGVRIAVIEKDLLFNDIGRKEGDIKVDINVNTRPQCFVYDVRIGETRSPSGKSRGNKTAVFEITIEADIEDSIKYIPDNGDGWLNVRFEKDKSIKSLPAYLKVKIERSGEGREYFMILEGVYRGESASVKLKKDSLSFLASGVGHDGPGVRAVYSVSKRIFTLNGKKYAADDYKGVSWQKGSYDIEIPDAPHKGGLSYVKAKRAKTWFRIGHSGDRYLHTGARSLGCITITEVERWDEIYDALIRARRGDFMSVGVIEIVD